MLGGKEVSCRGMTLSMKVRHPSGTGSRGGEKMTRRKRHFTWGTAPLHLKLDRWRNAVWRGRRGKGEDTEKKKGAELMRDQREGKNNSLVEGRSVPAREGPTWRWNEWWRAMNTQEEEQVIRDSRDEANHQPSQ